MERMKEKIKNGIQKFWNILVGQEEKVKSSGFDREKIASVVICLFLAFSIWLVVNLNRDYSINVNVPITLGKVTTKKALAEELPPDVNTIITGKGWNLIKLYNHPPQIYIDVASAQVNLFQQVRQQMGSQDITVSKVQPSYLQLKLTPKKTKVVPVIPNVSVDFAKQYDFLDKPVIQPDSIKIQGGAAQIDSINQWPTDSLTLKKVNKNIATQVNLKKSSSLIKLSASRVSYSAKVAKFTDSEVTIPVEKQGFPVVNIVSLSPSTVTVKYKIPLREYKKFNSKKLFQAYITYKQIQQDSTGFIKPHVKTLVQKAHLKIRSVQPKELSYFTIIGQSEGQH